MSNLNSKFIEGLDERLLELDDFSIPNDWWSRGHEYAWAIKFLKKDDVILDAGCGIEHPFKFYASKRVKKCIAVDADVRIKDIENTNSLELMFANITNMNSIKDNSIDKVFCISVLEHMYPANIIDALKEFKRVLKPDGQIILTLDYPMLAPESLINHMDKAGLSFVGNADFTINKHLVIKGSYANLKCYRALLGIESVDLKSDLKPDEIIEEVDEETIVKDDLFEHDEIKEKKEVIEIKPNGPSETKKDKKKSRK